MLAGATQPVSGVFWSMLLKWMTIPKEAREFVNTKENPDQWMDNINFWVIAMALMAAVTPFIIMLKVWSFSRLSENVTYEVRRHLYLNILRKHMGWFDDRENAPSVLTTTMAKDTSIINGAASEALSPNVESGGAMLCGVIIGLIYCWPMALTVLATTPISIIGQSLEIKYTMGEGQDSEESKDEKEASLLVGDAIINYKTVQSFGYPEMISKKYIDWIAPAQKASCKKQALTGVAFGISQIGQYVTIAIMFYVAGEIIEGSFDPETGTFGWNPAEVFIALFAIFFGASAAGNAAAFGPDIGKAGTAAENIFKIIDYPSQIDAVEIDTQNTKKRLDTQSVKGKIEFKDVWFRYPTRKEDFVLRGLNITINPNESVALVGESGCGKSTFVSLLMRFYEVDSGEILLDGQNIKDINLHDLRKAVSLVMQEPIIFNYSILENILYGQLDATNSDVKASCDVANAMEFINQNQFNEEKDDSAITLLKDMENKKTQIVAIIGQAKYDEEIAVLKKIKAQEEKTGVFQSIAGDVDNRPDHSKTEKLTDGFQTQCGIKGNKLSGGQKQRVAIARTIIRKPRVLCLDEATSALDEESQKKVQEALDNAMEGRTTIIIAHRLSTIEKCQKIFVLENGRVLEEGGFNELKGKGGAFSKLSAAK